MPLLDPIVTLPTGRGLDIGPWLDAGITVLAILVTAAILLRLTRVLARRVIRALLTREKAEGGGRDLSAGEIKKRQDTIDALAGNFIRFFVVVVAALMILHTILPAVDIGPAIAGLGIAGIAVGLGTQNLVRDYLNGALILLENQYAIGDVVRIAGVSGKVEDFTLRRTTLRDTQGAVHTVPNSQITVATNYTREWARVNEDVPVAYGTNIDRATQVVDGVGQGLAADPDWAERIVEAPHVERISQIGEAGITLKVLGTVRASEQWAVSGEFRRRLLVAFAEAGLAMTAAQAAATPPPPPPSPRRRTR